MSELTLGMGENLQGVRVVRAFASQKHELDRFDRTSDEALRLSMARINTRLLSMSLMNLAYYTAMGLVLLVGGQRIAAGHLSVGTLTFMAILQQPVRQVGMIVNASARATTSGSRDLQQGHRQGCSWQVHRNLQGLPR